MKKSIKITTDDLCKSSKEQQIAYSGAQTSKASQETSHFFNKRFSRGSNASSNSKNYPSQLTHLSAMSSPSMVMNNPVKFRQLQDKKDSSHST